MTFTPEQTKLLDGPLDPKNVAQRSQAGRSLSYIEGWHAIAEANRIFGFDAWTRETVELRQLGEAYQTTGKDTVRVNYMARVRITVGDVVREGCGFGQGIDRDVGQAHESALKEAETDAMKRALMTFGNPFGLALYDKTQANVQAPEPERKKIDPNALISDKTRHALQDLIITSGGDVSQFCRDNSITSLSALTNHQAATLAEPLKQKKAA